MTEKLETQQFLVFRAGNRRFGIPLDRVRGAARPRRITPLPGAPSDYAGLALVRGEPIGVLDATAALGTQSFLGERQNSKYREASPPPSALPLNLMERGPGGEAGTFASRPLVILLESDPRGLLVDRIDSIEEYRASQISPAPESAKKLTGFVPEGDHLLGLVNLDALFAGGKT